MATNFGQERPRGEPGRQEDGPVVPAGEA
jgi:hypothetical protein